MSLLKNLFKTTKDTPAFAVETVPGTIYAPIAGNAVSLSEINNGVFSEGILGQGCGIQPSAETIYAPFDGTIVQIADTKHAIGIMSPDNIELLIHVGIDTVSINGKGFHVHVATGEHVKCGQKLLTFSQKEIKAAGFRSTVSIIVTNPDEHQTIKLCSTGPINHAEPLLIVR